MRIGVISDTHGLVRPEALDAFRGVDHILHCEDIGGEEVLALLRAIAPVTACAGNVDGFRCGDAGETARAVFEGLRFFLVHILDRPHRPRPEVLAELRREPADVVLFGHSHLPHDERIGEVWYFNPASAGPRRFDYPVSVGLFEKRPDGWQARHLPLDERSRAALRAHHNQLSNR
jgi:putative phosphoesterase